LPEAQLDRFMLKIRVDYPTREQEITITKRGSTAYSYETGQILTVEELLSMQELVRKTPVGEHVYEFAVDLVRKSRPAKEKNNGFVSEMVAWGAGPRASICLLLAAKARALLQGRYHATTEDVIAVALPVLRHRLIPSFNAEAAGQSSDSIIHRLIEESAVPNQRTTAPRISPPPISQAAIQNSR
jgi:MoxR-like ATPase